MTTIVDEKDFDVFQGLCKYSNSACTDPDGHTAMDIACNRADRIPDCYSRGVCDAEHCPYCRTQTYTRYIAIYSGGEKIYEGEAQVSKHLFY